MIVNIRGTGGAGKSHIVRKAMERYANRVAQYADGRRQPVGYICQAESICEPLAPLFIVGHYETACGGGDTIKTPAEVFAMVGEMARAEMDVLFEGIIAQDDVVRTVDLHRAFPGGLKVISLRVPMETCLASIQQRRVARGDERPLSPKNTVARAKRLEGTMSRLRDAGVDARWMGRDEALAATLEALGWHTA